MTRICYKNDKNYIDVFCLILLFIEFIHEGDSHGFCFMKDFGNHKHSFEGYLSEAYSEPCPTYRMKDFARIVTEWSLLTIFSKSFYATMGSEYFLPVAFSRIFEAC